MTPDQIRFFNTLTHKKERFDPIEPGVVRLYVCGPTVNNEPHVGHGRSYVIFDVLRRFLEARGFMVRHVQNFTDVEESIARNAAAEGMELLPYANRMITRYNEEMMHLQVLPPHHQPRVSEYMPQIVEATSTLERAGNAYRIPDALVYDTVKCETFGALTGDKLEAAFADPPGHVDTRGRRHPSDFVLWRLRDDAGRLWDSPWGQGRPGWHTECAVMATTLLGPSIDIHGGGVDLVYPHHECERAIAEALTGRPFARFFLHNGFVTQKRLKMSKSLGNYLFLKDVRRQWSAPVLRYAFMSLHYRKDLAWEDAHLATCKALVDDLAANIARFEDDEPCEGPTPAECPEFWKALSDDLRAQDALACIQHCAERAADTRASMSREVRGATRAFMDDALYVLGFEGIAPWNR